LIGFMGLGLVCVLRLAAHWHPIWQSAPPVTVGLVTFPLGFLIGIGVFDYWAYYVCGKPTCPDDHSSHFAPARIGGAEIWKRLDDSQ
jgi:hypothetical protein